MQEVAQEKLIYRQLQDMQQEYIDDELKKGNTDVRVKVKPIDMLPPVDENYAASAMQQRRDRSKSKSKSPPRGMLGKSDSQKKLSRLEAQSDNSSLKKLQQDRSQPRLMNLAEEYTNDSHFAMAGPGAFQMPDPRQQVLYQPPTLGIVENQMDRLNKLQLEIEAKYRQSQLDHQVVLQDSSLII